MCLSIALQACLPILHLGLTWYRGWVGIVVHLDEFIVQRNFEDEDGVVHEYQEIASGEAWNGGPVLISWKDAQMTEDSYNVVIHEFVHKIDMLNGDADGIPPLHADMSRETWETCLLAAYDDFCQRLSISEVQGTDTMIDPYAAEHPGEFLQSFPKCFLLPLKPFILNTPTCSINSAFFIAQIPSEIFHHAQPTQGLMHNRYSISMEVDYGKAANDPRC